MALIIDIETTSWFKSDEHRDLTLKERRDKRITKSDKIIEDNKKIIQNAALSPYTGQITVIGLRYTEVEESVFYTNNYIDPIDPLVMGRKTEELMLIDVWKQIKQNYFNKGERLVGFRSKDFDLPYMFIRSLILGVDPEIDYLSLIHPYQNDIHLDIKSFFGKGSLKEISYVLDCKTENELDGSILPDLWWADPAKVIDKCRSDLIQTESIYRKVEKWIPQRLQMYSYSKTDTTGLV